jgi:hypothetical protein
MIVIGSTALEFQMKRLGLPFRQPADLDVICTEAEMREHARLDGIVLTKLAEYKWQGASRDWRNTIGKVEYELLEHSQSGQRYLNYVNWQPRDLLYSGYAGIEMIIAPLEVLYSIKMSHRHYPRAWKKHMEDIILMHSINFGDDVLGDTTKIREKETAERYGALKTPSLNKTAAEFFDDTVSNKIFIHDQIHEVMAHRERPMFEYIKKDTEKVACSKEKFYDLNFLHQRFCVLEEAYVIALERCILPMLFAGGPPVTSAEALDYAIMRICTTLCSGWFREFATMNYGAIMAARDKFYVERFLAAFEDGRIKKIVWCAKPGDITEVDGVIWTNVGKIVLDKET